MNYFEVLEDLVLIEGLSGYEDKVAVAVKKWLEPSVDDMYIDKVGNVIAKVGGTDSKAPTVMVAAHMDSLGFVVRRTNKFFCMHLTHGNLSPASEDCTQ